VEHLIVCPRGTAKQPTTTNKMPTP